VLALTVTAGTASADACDEGEIVVKFSHVTNTDKHLKGIDASLLEQRINDEVNDTMCMVVYPNSTLYDHNKVLEAVLQGDVQLAAPSLSKFEKFTKQFRLFDLPFMFKNINAVEAFQASGDGQAMRNRMQRRGLQGLGYWHDGMKQMSANKPLVQRSDASGLKFREQFMTIMHEVTNTRTFETSKVNTAAKEAIIAAGGTVRQLTSEQRQAEVDAMKPVWEQFSDNVGQDMIDAAKAINAGL